MKLSLDPAITAPARVSADSVALAAWYDAHPAIRRLWAIRHGHELSVFVTLEPTMDSSETYSAWFACNHGWANELRSIINSTVSLELLEEPAVEEFEIDIEGEIVASICWRDPTYFWLAD
jgi:hypothetical protein